ncbi:MAG: hypothetical protein ABJX82_21615, partial [Paracoccaceae bacterium]
WAVLLCDLRRHLLVTARTRAVDMRPQLPRPFLVPAFPAQDVRCALTPPHVYVVDVPFDEVGYLSVRPFHTDLQCLGHHLPVDLAA